MSLADGLGGEEERVVALHGLATQLVRLDAHAGHGDVAVQVCRGARG